MPAALQRQTPHFVQMMVARLMRSDRQWWNEQQLGNSESNQSSYSVKW